ncbi:hypothetical protein SAMN05421505_109175 [Sinosporangium album]|uniref:Uncharacterized protein n=1 Tax=Sinosporangium album TaxID=504805 RepID=A0A1G7YAU4_9ACTN|nr:hypothetical protein [Sinosporangium album]SDG93608.1 hypothetical protein SAMN05421505_109175 [Sinosporangium album]
MKNYVTSTMPWLASARLFGMSGVSVSTSAAGFAARPVTCAPSGATLATPSLTIAPPAATGGSRRSFSLVKLRHVELVSRAGRDLLAQAAASHEGVLPTTAVPSSAPESADALLPIEAEAAINAVVAEAPADAEATTAHATAYDGSAVAAFGDAEADNLPGDVDGVLPATGGLVDEPKQQTANGGLRPTQQCDPNTWRPPAIT